MAVALDLARLAEGRTSPNPMVGALIVKKGRIIGRGFHRGPGHPHAEIEALNAVCKGGVTPPLQGATLYVSLEPCCPPKKGGRTPPCTKAILASGIKHVVVGMKDPDPRMRGRGISFLKKAGIKVQVGVLEKEGLALNEAYVTHRTKKRPFVTLKIAATRDGKVGIKRRRGDTKGAAPRPRVRPFKITGPEADAQVHALRDRVDAILVGAGTVSCDDPRLTTRLKGRKGKDPIRVILDGRLRVSPRARVLNLKSAAPTWIATAVAETSAKARRLRKKGAAILSLKGDPRGRVDPGRLLRELGRRGVTHLLVEGGPRVWASFLERRVVDRVLLFIAPRYLGVKGIPAFSRPTGGPGLVFSSLRRLGRDWMAEADL